MKKLAITVLKCLAFLTLWALLLTPVIMPAVMIGGENWFADRGWRLFTEIGSAVAIFAALVFMALVVDKRPLATIGFSPLARAPFGVIVGALLGAAILVVPIGVLWAMGAARVAPDWTGFSAEALGVGLLLCLFNVITQEILARGYIFQEVRGKYGFVSATLATTVLFLAVHAAALMQGTQGIIAGANIFLASVMICVALERSGSLWLPIGIHLGWNGLQGPVLGINVTGTEIGLGGWRVFEFNGDALITGGAMGVEGGLVGLIGPAIGVLAVLVWPKRVPGQ
jgi:membrane protease YdiL (CAAX protease family)